MLHKSPVEEHKKPSCIAVIILMKKCQTYLPVVQLMYNLTTSILCHCPSDSWLAWRAFFDPFNSLPFSCSRIGSFPWKEDCSFSDIGLYILNDVPPALCCAIFSLLSCSHAYQIFSDLSTWKCSFWVPGSVLSQSYNCWRRRCMFIENKLDAFVIAFYQVI